MLSSCGVTIHVVVVVVIVLRCPKVRGWEEFVAETVTSFSRSWVYLVIIVVGGNVVIVIFFVSAGGVTGICTVLSAVLGRVLIWIRKQSEMMSL